MKIFGVEMQGEFIVESLATLPAWQASDEGRLVYAEDVNKLYVGTSTQWTDLMAVTTVAQTLATLPTWQESDEGRLVYVRDEDKFFGGSDSTSWIGLTGVTPYSSLPVWTSDDEGKLVYAEDEELIYFGNSTSWVSVSNSSLDGDVGIGGSPGPTVPTLRRCTINTNTGAITTGDGPDLMLNGSDDNSPDQEFIALKIWNAVWNDIADFQELDDKLIYGKCYYDTINGAKICDNRCQESVIGIASNTFGYALGANERKVPIAVSGWVLACVDKEYRIGVPLTNDENGNLTEMSLEEKQMYPERIVAIYKKREINKLWGPEGKEIKVNNRHWVKVK